MTPTRSQLDAALPRVPAGISAMCGNLTKPDGRAVALDWLEALIERAVELQHCDSGLCEPESDARAKIGQGPPRNGTERLSASFAPPRKGTHESDLSAARICRLAPRDTPLSAHPDPDIYLTARDWSRSL